MPITTSTPTSTLRQTISYLDNAIETLRRTNLAESAALILLETARRALMELEHPELIFNEEKASFFKKL